MSLIFGNVSEEDILLREELDVLAQKHDNISVYHVLNTPPVGWTQGSGFVNADMIKEHCPAPAKDIKMLLCGPLPMVKAMTEVKKFLCLLVRTDSNMSIAFFFFVEFD